MRYDDIEAHKSIVDDNTELILSIEKITTRLEKLEQCNSSLDSLEENIKSSSDKIKKIKNDTNTLPTKIKDEITNKFIEEIVSKLINKNQEKLQSEFDNSIEKLTLKLNTSDETKEYMKSQVNKIIEEIDKLNIIRGSIVKMVTELSTTRYKLQQRIKELNKMLPYLSTYMVNQRLAYIFSGYIICDYLSSDNSFSLISFITKLLNDYYY